MPHADNEPSLCPDHLPRGRRRSVLRSRLCTVAWLLPRGRAKNALLNLLGNTVHSSARLGLVLVVGDTKFEVGAGASIAGGNVIKRMRLVQLGVNAAVGRANLISASPMFQDGSDDRAVLRLGDEAFVTSRHSLDCSALVELGALSALGGHGSQVLTHSLDLELDLQSCAPVRVGERTFVSTRCVILPGVDIPPRSVVAAGAVVHQTDSWEPERLIAGVPARPVRRFVGKWSQRSVGATTTVGTWRAR